MILAAGQGKRMGGSFPKVIFEAGGRPLIRYLVDTVRRLGPLKTVVVTGYGAAEVEALFKKGEVCFARQTKPLGTGDAVRVGLEALGTVSGTVLVMCGDAPLIRGETLRRLILDHQATQADMTVVTARPADPRGYGRVIRNAAGDAVRIREEVDGSPEEREIREICTGLYAFQVSFLGEALPRLQRKNRQGEFYLTDLVAVAGDLGRRCRTLEGDDPLEFQGVNTWEDLAKVREAVRQRINREWMAKGVQIVDPASTFIDADVVCEPPLKILPFTVIEGRCRLGRHVSIGPFAHLRPGSVVMEGAHIGNFVELKKTRVGKGSKANHLTYLGDSDIGAKVNVGAGTITCNYDGRAKYPTRVGEGAFIGSDTQFVAPVRIGKGAYVGAGSTITKDVPSFALSLSRVEQKIIKGWARKRKGRA